MKNGVKIPSVCGVCRCYVVLHYEQINNRQNKSTQNKYNSDDRQSLKEPEMMMLCDKTKSKTKKTLINA